MTRRWPRCRQDPEQAVGLRPAACSLPAKPVPVPVVHGAVRVRLRRNGSRKPSTGQKRAGSWPFGLRSSRLRPFRAARSACTTGAYRIRKKSYAKVSELCKAVACRRRRRYTESCSKQRLACSGLDARIHSRKLTKSSRSTSFPSEPSSFTHFRRFWSLVKNKTLP